MKSKILIIVEGAKTDLRLMQHLLEVYNINDSHDIVSYDTNIYTLYQQMFKDKDPESFDLLQLLKERENNIEKKKIFDNRYSDILLIFDYDPQDPLYSQEKITEMTEYFRESSDMGKLYLNYPMVEAYYHMKSIPDELYNTYKASFYELKQGTYKQRVNRENRNHDYTKFAINKEECDIVIKQNIKKAYKIINKDCTYKEIPENVEILNKQLEEMQINHSVFVLCTCVFYIAEYNPKLITNDFTLGESI